MKKIAIRYGLWMFAGFTVFFLLMHLLGVSDNTYLRIFNGVIHFGLLWGAIRHYRRENPETVDNYVSGVAAGIYTSAIGVVGFVLFMLLFFAFNPAFLDSVRDTTPLGKYLTPITATLFIFAEGVSISLIGSYIVTRIVDMRWAEAHS